MINLRSYANKLLTLQDMILLDISGEFESVDDIPEEYLHTIRLQLQRKYFNREDMSQSEANGYNDLYYNCQILLENISDYDGSIDHWIDFNYLVKENVNYGRKILSEEE